MNMIVEVLPEMAVISVGHRPELEAFHQRKLNLMRHKGGARLARESARSPLSVSLRCKRLALTPIRIIAALAPGGDESRASTVPGLPTEFNFPAGPG